MSIFFCFLVFTTAILAFEGPVDHFTWIYMQASVKMIKNEIPVVVDKIKIRKKNLKQISSFFKHK